MEIRIAGVSSDSIVDGPGLRLTVFCQGCKRACPNCHNPQSHPLDGGKLADVRDIVGMMQKNPLMAGLTLSGGEPFLQPGACLALAQACHALGKNVWAYSGYTFEALRDMADPAVTALLGQVDVLVDGPFVLAKRSLNCPFRGSTNQRLIDVAKSLAEGQAVLYELPKW